MTELAQRIEALLFVCGEAVTLSEIAAATACDRSQIEAALTEITTSLKEHALTLVRSDTHVQLATAAHVSSFIQDALNPAEDRLSTAALETLAIVAYRGPVTRLTLDAIRGVDSRRMLRQLLSRGLVARVSGKTLPARYQVTELFLRNLGISSKQQLPDFEKLSLVQTDL